MHCEEVSEEALAVSKTLSRKYKSSYDAWDDSTQSTGSDSRGLAQGQMTLVVKNTFLTVVDGPEEEHALGGRMVRSLSDSEVGSRSRSESRHYESEAGSRTGSRSGSRNGSRRLSRTGSRGSAWSSEADSRADEEEDTLDELAEVEEETPSSEQEGGQLSPPAPGPVGKTGAAAAGKAEESWSVGSALHASKRCKPCMYFNTSVGCSFGAKCKFCHFPHARKTRQRPCKSTRNECKQMVSMLQTMYDKGDEFEAAAKQLASKSSYMKQILKGPSGSPSAGAGTKLSL